jgi:hypothetical protein
MERRQPRLRRVDVEGVGHAPTLAEPDAVAALDAFYLGDSASRAARWLGTGPVTTGIGREGSTR